MRLVQAEQHAAFHPLGREIHPPAGWRAGVRTSAADLVRCRQAGARAGRRPPGRACPGGIGGVVPVLNRAAAAAFGSKWGQGGTTRSGLGCSTSISLARLAVRLRAARSTRSPGRVRATDSGGVRGKPVAGAAHSCPITVSTGAATARLRYRAAAGLAAGSCDRASGLLLGLGRQRWLSLHRTGRRGRRHERRHLIAEGRPRRGPDRRRGADGHGRRARKRCSVKRTAPGRVSCRGSAPWHPRACGERD